MKRKYLYIVVAASLVTGMTACRKKSADVTPERDPNMAYVQWVNATVNSSRNYLYVNTSPVNGSSVAYGAVFPATAYAFGVYPGSNGITIKDTLATTTQVAQNFVQTFEKGKNYTVFTYDTITTPKRMVVENNFPIINPNFGMIRFTNLVYNPTAVPSVDVFSYRKNGYLYYNVPTATLTGYTMLDAGVTDTLYVYQNGTSNLIVKQAFTLVQGRCYTAVYRGSYRSTTRAISVVAHN